MTEQQPDMIKAFERLSVSDKLAMIDSEIATIARRKERLEQARHSLSFKHTGGKPSPEAFEIISYGGHPMQELLNMILNMHTVEKNSFESPSD